VFCIHKSAFATQHLYEKLCAVHVNHGENKFTTYSLQMEYS